MTDSNLHEEWLAEDTEGELAIDVYHDEHAIYIVAPLAGVRASDVDVSITDEVVTIRGERRPDTTAVEDKYFTKECYWGAFSRSYVLPMAIDSEGAKATLKDGLLRIAIPKDAKVKTKMIVVSDK